MTKPFSGGEPIPHDGRGVEFALLPGGGPFHYSEPSLIGSGAITGWTPRIVGTTPTATKGAAYGTLAASANSELQTAGLDYADALTVNLDLGAVIGLRGEFVTAEFIDTAVDELVLGFGSAYNSTLNSFTYNAWIRSFLSTGAVRPFAEVDTNATGGDSVLLDNPLGEIIAAATEFTMEVHIPPPVRLGRNVAGAPYAPRYAAFKFNGQPRARVLLVDLPANTMVQPICQLRRANNAELLTLTVKKLFSYQVLAALPTT